VLDKQNLFEKSENAILVGVIHNNQTDQQVAEYMEELAFLASTAGAVTDKKIVQRLQHPDSKTYVGKGKLEEIKKYAQTKNIGLLIFDMNFQVHKLAISKKQLESRPSTEAILSLIFLQGERKLPKPRHRLNLRNTNTFCQGYVVCGNTLNVWAEVLEQEGLVKQRLKLTDALFVKRLPS
jgi:GTP-binding protein HflX